MHSVLLIAKRSRSNLRSLADKPACRLVLLDYLHTHRDLPTRSKSPGTPLLRLEECVLANITYVQSSINATQKEAPPRAEAQGGVIKKKGEPKLQSAISALKTYVKFKMSRCVLQNLKFP